MTWPAALPVAALRVLRTAAGRRALQVALLVGGLFALGFLCGERAYAADGLSVDSGTLSAASAQSSSASADSASAPSSPVSSSAVVAAGSGGAVERSVTDPAGTAVEAAVGKSGQQAPAMSGPHSPAEPDPHTSPSLGVHDNEAPAPANPATSTPPAPPAPQAHPVPPATLTTPQSPAALVQGAGDRVIVPVVTVVESVTAGLAEAPPLSALPSLPSLPLLPAGPESPSWPGLPGFEVPGLPELPGAPGLPALPGGPAQILPAPVTATPQPGSEAPASGGVRDDESRTGAAARVAYGPRFVAGAAVRDTWATNGAHRLVPRGYTPVHQAPVEQPAGVAGNRSAGDNGTSRHGDAHAVSLSRRDMLLLVPGAAVAGDADEVQDRHGDIPVSPA